jgi:hypothetical protein
MFDVAAYALFIVVMIGFLRYVQGGVESEQASNHKPPEPRL